MKFFSKIVFALICLASLVLLSAFYLQNAQLVTIDLLFNQSIEFPLGLALVLSLLCGVVLGLLAAVPALIAHKARLVSSKRRLQANS